MSKRGESPQPIRFWIGIDPGENTGIAVWDNTEKSVRFTACLDFWDTVAFLETAWKKHCAVVLEAPQLATGALYARHDNEQNARKRVRMARNVGANHNDAKRLREKMQRLGLIVIEVRPTAKGRRMVDPETKKPYTGKWHPEEVKLATGYDGNPNNEHVRDAIMLAYHECKRKGGMYYAT